MSCPAHRVRDRPFAIAEQAAGRFVPVVNTTSASAHDAAHCMRCWVLPDACLEMAEQLLGRGTLLPTQTQAVGEGEPMVGKYCRGCYCNFPKPEGSPRSIKDGHT